MPASGVPSHANAGWPLAPRLQKKTIKNSKLTYRSAQLRLKVCPHPAQPPLTKQAPVDIQQVSAAGSRTSASTRCTSHSLKTSALRLTIPQASEEPHVRHQPAWRPVPPPTLVVRPDRRPQQAHAALHDRRHQPAELSVNPQPPPRALLFLAPATLRCTTYPNERVCSSSQSPPSRFKFFWAFAQIRLGLAHPLIKGCLFFRFDKTPCRQSPHKTHR